MADVKIKGKEKKTLFGGTKSKTVSYDDQGRKIVTKVKRRKSGKIRKTKTRISRKGSLIGGSTVSKEKFDKSGKLRKTVESENLGLQGIRTVTGKTRRRKGKKVKGSVTKGIMQKGGRKYKSGGFLEPRIPNLDTM